MDMKQKINDANQTAFELMAKIQPVLVDIDLAINVIPGMDTNTILHAGPPITWERMCGPTQGAIAGILVYEGMANSIEEGYDLATSGEIKFDSNHDHDTV